MLSCTNILLALLYFGMPNDLQFVLLYSNFNFLVAVKAPLYHIVEERTLQQKDLNISQQVQKVIAKMVT